MKKHWWKFLGVLIVFYSIIAGILAPLNPGVERIDKSRCEAGESFVMKIQGYNTNFNAGDKKSRVWLKLDDEHAIQAQQVLVVSDQVLKASFYIPTVLPNDKQINELTLIVDNPSDGYFTLPSAIFVKAISDPNQAELPIWKKTPIVNLNEHSKFGFPYRNLLKETIRNIYYHVPMWFGMMLLFAGSVWCSFRYIRTSNLDFDYRATALLQVGILFGIMGLITGMVWAKHTWGAYWSWDIKQNMSAITVLIYSALLVLRSSFQDEQRKARLSAGYNIFAFILMIPLLFVIPRMADSLHPGNGGNPALGSEDMDNTMRMVFYPAVIGWTLVGLWMANLNYRFFKVRERLYN